MDIIPIVLCGGSGKRLWPLSRETHPKQFHKLYNNKSLLENTLDFGHQIPNSMPAILVTNYNRRYIVSENIINSGVKIGKVIYEPVGRDTAGAICVAALQALEDYDDPVLVTLPIDHIMNNIEMTQFETACNYTLNNKLVTFGTEPSYPATQFGYVHLGQTINSDFFEVAEFCEKPNQQAAKEFLAQGNYLWNSGIYIFRAEHIIREYKRLDKKMLKDCQNALKNAKRVQQSIYIQSKDYEKITDVSFDYAISEKTQEIVVKKLQGDWKDIGSWTNLKQVGASDSNNNVLVGDVCAMYCNNCYIRSANKPIVTLGLQDTYIIDTADALFVTNEKHIPFINEVFDTVNQYNTELTKFMDTVYRPWGKYQTILNENNLKIKKLFINPHKRISLQLHNYRTEHWTILSGSAAITLGDKINDYSIGQSIDIPIKTKHRVENKTNELLVIIEVQRGEKLLETDITRFEDDFNRKPDEF